MNTEHPLKCILKEQPLAFRNIHLTLKKKVVCSRNVVKIYLQNIHSSKIKRKKKDPSPSLYFI